MFKVGRIVILATLLLNSMAIGPSSLAQVSTADAQATGDVPGYPGCQSSSSALFGHAPLTVDFSAQSPDELVAYNWSFGDGAGATGKNVTHTFTAEGTYRVRAFVTDHRGFYSTCPILIIEVTTNPNPATPVAPTMPATPSANGSNIPAANNVTGDNNAANSVVCGDDCDITINNATDPVPAAANPNNGLEMILQAIARWIDRH